MNSVEAKLHGLRVVYMAILATVPMYAVAGEMMGPPPRDAALIHKVLVVVLVSLLGALTVVRTRWIGPAAEALGVKPDDMEALQRWHSGHVICFVLAETVALLGFALRFLGGSLMQAAPFYAAGFVLLLFLMPRNPTRQ